MKENLIDENRQIVKYMLIVVIIVILLYSIYSFFIIQNNLENLESNLENNLQEISKKQTEVIYEKIQYYIKETKMIKEFYSKLDSYNIQEEINKINNLSNENMIINYTDIEGNILIQEDGNGSLNGIKDTIFFEEAIKGKEILTKQIDKNGDIYLVYTTSLEKDNEVTGVILAWLNIDILDEILNNKIFDGLGYFSLISSDKTIILDKNAQLNGENIIDIIQNENKEDVVESVNKILNNNNHQTIKVTLLGDEKYLSITTLEVYNSTLYLLSFVDTEYINSDIQIVGRDLYIALLVTLIIFIFGSSYMFRQRKKHMKKLYTVAYIDNLTKGFNLNYLYMKIDNLIENNKKYSLIYLDIKRFSSINEIFGIEKANKIILELYDILKEELKTYSNLVRVTESQFIIIKEYEDSLEIRELLEKINKKLVKFSENGKVNIQLNISAGVCYDINSRQLIKYINYANLTRMLIENSVDQIYKEYDDEIMRMEKERMLVENDIKEAVEKDYFIVHYQPKYDSRNNEIIGAEALVRIMHPEKGLIAPGKFIPIAEKANYISTIDRIIFTKVCKDLEILKNQNKKIIPISVNLSRLELFNTNLINFIEVNVEKHGVEREWIEFEITESSAVDDFEILIKILKELKIKGYQLMLDDFGSGYSSYSSIIEMPIDVIKIDKSFIDAITFSDKHLNVVKNIVDLSNILNIKILAEGVENKKQIEVLKQIGCYNIQGYVYSKPIEFNKFKDLF